MFSHRRFVLFIVMGSFAAMLSYSTNVFPAGGPQTIIDKPDPILGVPQTIIRKLDKIQNTLDNQVIPKLDQCTQCPECPECKAGFPKTGQTTSYQAGDDGSFQKGIPWPNPRFTDNGNGTITDNLTGLIWLKDANCFGEQTWADALSACNTLASPACGLTDGSSDGDWHLPNAFELVSLIHWGFWNPALPNTAGTGQWSQGNPFLNVVTSGQCFYFTSTTYLFHNDPQTGEAWTVPMSSGGIVDKSKDTPFYVWPVRNAK
jgi:hypothetical protein